MRPLLSEPRNIYGDCCDECGHGSGGHYKGCSEAIPPGYACVLVNYPGFGSLWLEEAYLVATDEGDYVVGIAWDDSGVGSAYMPDDWTGEEVTMNFPATCIRKVGPNGGPLLHKEGAIL